MILGGEWRHIHSHLKLMIAGTDQNAAQRANISEVSAPCERDVPLTRQQVVGRIQIDPARFSTPKLKPGMRGIGTYEFLLARWWSGFEITADVPGRQTKRPQTSNLKLSEILADAAALAEHLFERSRNGRCLRGEFEVRVDFSYQLNASFQQRSCPSERRSGIDLKLGEQRNEW